MDVIRVSSWAELTEALYAGSWQPGLGRFRSPYAFRGVHDAAQSFGTSLSRLGTQACELEAHILRNFRKYARRDAVPDDSLWNWLALAQHHGVPTRLLDWTYSPYVALHFATAGRECGDQDATVACVDYMRAKALLPNGLHRLLREEGSNVFTAEMLGHAAASLRELDALAETVFLAFFEPPALDARIVNQFALFSLLSNAQATLDDWLAQHPDLARTIVIPSALTQEVRDKLDQANITERVLFPGLDGLGQWLTRYYTPMRDRTSSTNARRGELGLGSG